jgi:hypothetical protein
MTIDSGADHSVSARSQCRFATELDTPEQRRGSGEPDSDVDHDTARRRCSGDIHEHWPKSARDGMVLAMGRDLE